MVQGKPRLWFFIIWSMAMGHTIPPREEPPRTIPMDAARFFAVTFLATRASIGQETRDMEMPSRTPWQRRNCQNCLQREIIIILKTMPMAPVQVRSWK
jgi:hypothetical protein